MYIIRTDEIKDEDGKLFTVYGFDVVLPDNNEIVDSYPDIFFDMENAEKFIEGLNNSDIEANHIPEIIEDVLCALHSPDIVI